MKQLSKNLLTGVCLVALLTAGVNETRGTGLRMPDQDAFATGRGEAFAATADNPSAIYYNPAGISQLDGHQVRLGVYGLYIEPSYTSPRTGRTFESDRNYHAVPQFFYTYGPEETDLTLGLGLYSPFGLSSRWPQDTGFRTVATEGVLSYYTINPTVAWGRENFSIAAGLTLNYAETELQQGLLWPAQPFDNFRFKGNDWAVGYNLGALWKPHEKISLGVNFRSRTDVEMEGYTEYYNSVPLPLGLVTVPAFPTQHVGAEGEMSFPLNAVFGISYRPTPKWNFEFNADYTAWNQVTSIEVTQDRAFPPLIPQTLVVPLGWESSWYYEFGATYFFENGWHVSGGYIFNENSLPDANYNPLVADLDRHFLSAGVGRKGEQLSYDVAYQFGYGPTRTVSTGYSPADGDYEFLSHAIFLSIGWHF